MLSAAAACCIFVPFILFRDRPLSGTPQDIALDAATAILGAVGLTVIPTWVVIVGVHQYQARLVTAGVQLVAGGIIGAVAAFVIPAIELIGKHVPFRVFS